MDYESLTNDGVITPAIAYIGEIIFGCTNPVAINYNPEATADDGTCEFYYGPMWYISVSGSNEIGNGTYDNPFATIQRGINFSADGDSVIVLPGTYSENIYFDGKNITLESYGSADETIINGGGAGNTILLNGNSTVDGLTITNAGSDAADGGITVSGQYSPLVTNNIITQNLRNGISIAPGNSPSPLIAGNIISGNEVHGIFIYGSTGSIDSSTILKNNVIINNGHDGIYCQGESNISPLIVNNTIANNERNGIMLVMESNPIIINNIIWGNPNSTFYFSGNTNYPQLSYNDIEGSFPDEGIDNGGNIYLNPLFVASNIDNYYLDSMSPCIDAGALDLDGDGYTWEID